ncbi:MAG: hypothetical protein COY57_01680 [Flavobacteriales bacterium CG_4_10_14_0_8_um_filter_32_5]|nr:MAG: hypothetical protein COY57_01680 [Flavobacteriales bacterium CG_4_10_14_0_8_um_filter_32_5]
MRNTIFFLSLFGIFIIYNTSSTLLAQDVVVGDTSSIVEGKAQDFYNSGVQKIEAKNLNGAVEDFNQAIELLPSFEKAYFNRGSVKYQLKNYNEAIVDFNKVVELNPDSNNAHFLRGRS